jgi:hypothetical protein
MLKTRIGAVAEEFSADRVSQQLKTISGRVHRTLAGFERRIKKEVETFREENESDEELVDAKIGSILLQCDAAVDRYARQDVGKHWRTRRCGNWGYLYQIQQQIADDTFPHVDSLHQRQVTRFEAAILRIRERMGQLQRSLADIEGEAHLETPLEPLALSEAILTTGKSFVSQAAGLVEDQRDAMVRHLDDFVSNEVRDRIYQARFEVRLIHGKGTTAQQTSEVDNFYQELKCSLRESMNEHLRGLVKRFSQILVSEADSLSPRTKQEVSFLIDDRQDAIDSNLKEMNEAQKAETLNAL